MADRCDVVEVADFDVYVSAYTCCLDMLCTSSPWWVHYHLPRITEFRAECRCPVAVWVCPDFVVAFGDVCGPVVWSWVWASLGLDLAWGDYASALS